MLGKKLASAITLTISLLSLPTTAGVIFGSVGDLGGGYRWDADYYEIGGRERSLDGGLRYSMQGGSLTTYRDLFSWDISPTLEAFGITIRQAFNAWQSVDPVTGLTTSLNFVDDSATTQVIGNGYGTVNINGAYTFPTADGSNTQVLQTDGSGNVSFATPAAAGISMGQAIAMAIVFG